MMPTFSPMFLLAGIFCLSVAALAAAIGQRLYRRKRLRHLAAERGWEFITVWDGDLARRVLPHLPLGAADVRVGERLENASLDRVVARVDYCLGTVGHRRNSTRIMRFPLAQQGDFEIVQADSSLGWLQQYRSLTR